jgi:MFS family permease
MASRRVGSHACRFAGEHAKDKHAFGLTDIQVGASATGYLAGAVVGALFFGWLTDRRGRKKLFLITLAL